MEKGFQGIPKPREELDLNKGQPEGDLSKIMSVLHESLHDRLIFPFEFPWACLHTSLDNCYPKQRR